MNKPAYQLTSHSSGSKREFWAITWPLMIGLLSATLMLFVDRLFLARWNPLGLNAAVTGSMAYYMFLVIPMAVVEISEVLVGRLNGEGRLREAGAASWQMTLLSIALSPLFLLIALFAPMFLFGDSSNRVFETDYFQTLMICAPLQCATIGVSGFFIGIGNVKIVTFSAIIGNIVNIVLDYWMIFGGGFMPELGVVGAATATVLAQFIQLVYLLCIFWKRRNRVDYGTSSIRFHRQFLFEGLKIGIPSGAGRCLEVIAHFLFFKLVMSVGSEQMVLVAIAQSIYILTSFVIDAQSKGAATIISNLLGADQKTPIRRVLRSSFTLHSFYFLIVLAIVWFFPEPIFALFSAKESVALKMTPELMQTFQNALILVSFFFLFDGYAWILSGFLTAAKDTRFLFWASLLVNWVAYVPPTVWFVGYYKGGADIAWSIIVIVTSLNVVLYLWRYLSGRWLTYDQNRAVL